ncbi:hypothetical protein HNR38_001642 [Marinobacter oulmenensis]|uniref:Uncharacterized protein n=1 Tax=Marinobacter oulmenensis TaxID=643747 RepID=A0A840UJ50_9GAMM|nr:hypothetical protein [Marinobacter oulmenensis]
MSGRLIAGRCAVGIRADMTEPNQEDPKAEGYDGSNRADVNLYLLPITGASGDFGIELRISDAKFSIGLWLMVRNVITEGS